jgi:hypothetical protein
MKHLLVRLSLLALLALGLATTAAQEPDGRAHHVAVVVQYASGQVEARCVGFDDESISGYDALTLAGFNVVAEGSAGLGAMVCSIDGVGCDYPTESCACQCEGGTCAYWAYSHLKDGVWQYSAQGASAYRVRDGAVEGWAWGGGSVQRGASPPVVSWGDICAAQAAAPPTAIPPTSIPPTAPPTAAPPTRVPPTAPPPTRVPPTAPPTRVPPTAPPPTRVPPTAPPPTRSAATSAPTRSASGQRVPAVTVGAPTVTAATSTSAPTTRPTSPAVTTAPAGLEPSPTPLAAGVAPAQRQTRPTASGWLNYLAFGAIAASLGAGVLIMRRRRDQ